MQGRYGATGYGKGVLESADLDAVLRVAIYRAAIYGMLFLDQLHASCKIA